MEAEAGWLPTQQAQAGAGRPRGKRRPWAMAVIARKGSKSESQPVQSPLSVGTGWEAPHAGLCWGWGEEVPAAAHCPCARAGKEGGKERSSVNWEGS